LKEAFMNENLNTMNLKQATLYGNKLYGGKSPTILGLGQFA